MSTQIETLKKRLTLGSLPESAKAAIRKQIEQLENEAMGEQESSTKQQEKLEKEEESKEAEVDDKIEKLKKRLTLGSLPESAKAAIRKQIEDAEKLKSEAKKERAEEKKEAEKKQAEVKAKVKEAVEKVKKVVKEAPKKVSAEKTPAKAKAVEKKVEKEVKKEIEKAKTEVKKAKVEGKKVEAKKAEGAKKRKKKFDKMLTDLQRLINKDKKLKALYGADNPSDLKRDAGRMAKPFGWRYKGEHNYKVPPKSERGNDNTYYEGRPEKADLRRRTYPYLEMGGDVMGRDSYGNYYTVQIQTMTNGFNEEVKKFGF
jgi:DNA repair exonuclease SbcCD ATPase subunit